MRKPSFRYFSGKTRIRQWLRQLFPQSGRTFGDCFAGLGNVFYEVHDLDYEDFVLNDINPFLTDLKEINVDEIPTEISREDFQKWKKDPSPMARVIEPECTFAGKGYRYGYFVRNFPLVKVRMGAAQKLLQSATITNQSWEDIKWDSYEEEDFWYFDPPYFQTECPFPQINHDRLIEMLNGAKFRWAVSGYPNELYEKNLVFKNKYETEKNADLKGANARTKQTLTETLWTNY